jgi:hypothetical protein
MHILRVFYANRLLWCLGLLALFVWTSGCESSPTAQVEAAKDGEYGKAEREARLKAYGTTSSPKTTDMPKKKR